MAERGPRQEVCTVRERLADDVGKVAIADRKRLHEVIVEGQIHVGVVAHRVVVRRLIGLFRHLVHLDEPPVAAPLQHVVRVQEVALSMAPNPAVIEVRPDAVPRIVEGSHAVAL